VAEPIRVSPWVTHERLDDEVIAINLETGAYYALDGVAADCWALVAAGSSIDDAIGTLCERYEVDAGRARADVDDFVAELQRERLVIDADDGVVSQLALPATTGRRAYAPPAVQKYDDLEDLLLLDPIHEVDEAGWPVARAD
jgi:hypothetical protein